MRKQAVFIRVPFDGAVLLFGGAMSEAPQNIAGEIHQILRNMSLSIIQETIKT